MTTYDNYYFDVKVGRCEFMSFVNDVIDHGCLICVFFFFFRIKEKEIQFQLLFYNIPPKFFFFFFLYIFYFSSLQLNIYNG